jgi:hypothetical protein
MRLVYTKLSRTVAAALLAVAFAGSNLALAEEVTQDDEWYTGPAYAEPEPDPNIERAICESLERTEIAADLNTEELFELTDNLEECVLE